MADQAKLDRAVELYREGKDFRTAGELAGGLEPHEVFEAVEAAGVELRYQPGERMADDGAYSGWAGTR